MIDFNMSSDPTTIVDHLDTAELRRRLMQLDRERSAVIVLLRAALARDRREHRHMAQRGRRRKVVTRG
jgi:hypothetical protein